MSKQLTGLSRSQPYLALGGKIKQREIQQTLNYVISAPNTSASAIVAECSGTGTSGTIDYAEMDYPRNLAVKFTEASGTAWNASVTLYGKNQFGEVINESFAIAGDGTVTVNGTKCFSYLGTATLTNASGQAAGDDWCVGYISDAGTCAFGIPTKVSGSADIVNLRWIDGAHGTGALTGNKPGTATIDTVNHTFIPTAAIVSDDDWILQYKSDYTTDDNEYSQPNPSVITNA